MVKVVKNLVPASIKNKVTYSNTNPCTHIVIHETANTSKGANADAHGRLQANGNSRQASWHYTCDDKHAVQSFSDTSQCWHAGSSFNRNSIGVEICVNSDGDYKKAVDNAAELVKSLMKKHNIPAKNVIQHNGASGKDCPHFMRAGSKGVTWPQFKKMIGDKKGSTTTSKPSKSKPAKKKKKSNLTVDGKAGKSTVKAIQKATGSKYKDGVFSGQPSNSVTKAFYSGISYGSGGSPSVKLFQKKIGTTADGHIGPNTVRALQRYLGTTVDGVISRPTSVVVKELQKRLNKGTF